MTTKFSSDLKWATINRKFSTKDINSKSLIGGANLLFGIIYLRK